MDILTFLVTMVVSIAVGYIGTRCLRSNTHNTSGYAGRVPRDEDGRIKPPPAPPVRNPPPPAWPYERIAELELLLRESEQRSLEEVQVAGLTAEHSYWIYTVDGSRALNKPVHQTICYTDSRRTAVSLITANPEARIELKPIWRLPDGRIAFRDRRGQRPTLTLINPELVK